MDMAELTKAGIDYEEGLQRFGGKATLYEDCLHSFFEGDEITTLKAQLEGENYAAAYHTAHDLKGASGNLSLNRLYSAASRLADMLRGGSCEAQSVMQLYVETEAAYLNARRAVGHQLPQKKPAAKPPARKTSTR